MLNAYGNRVTVDDISYKEIHDKINTISIKLSELSEIEGIIVIGSTTEHAIDPFSDVDLKIFYEEQEIAKDQILKIYKDLGATEDNNKSLHSPFDEFSFKFDKIYIETEICKLSKVKEKIQRILKGVESEDCYIYHLQQAKVILDRQGNIKNFIDEIKNIAYPEDLVNKITNKYEAVSLKLLLAAIKREDWANAQHWLWRIFMDTTRILFAKNKKFMPGQKRLLSFYIPELEKLPNNYVKFWSDVFKNGVTNWSEVFEQALKFMLEVRGY